MANVAHLVRASGCGSEGRGFDPLHSPQVKSRSDTYVSIDRVFIFLYIASISKQFRRLGFFYLRFLSPDQA